MTQALLRADSITSLALQRKHANRKPNSISQITESDPSVYCPADTQAIVPFSQIEMNKNNSYSRYHQHRTEHILFAKLWVKLPHPKRTINKEEGGTTKTLATITSPRHPAQISLP